MREKLILIDGNLYHADRPKDCRNCYFWQNNKKGCTFGKMNCYYLAKTPYPESPCEHCPYGPCISFCMRKVLGSREVPKNA